MSEKHNVVTGDRGGSLPAYLAPQSYTFGAAIKWAKDGRKVRRRSWDEGDHVHAHYPYPDLKGAPHLIYEHASGMRRTWDPTQEDLFAEDWLLIDLLDDIAMEADRINGPPGQLTDEERAVWTSPMWVLRLRDELDELNARIGKLGAFMGDPVTALMAEDRDLIAQQFNYMLGYRDILLERLARYEGKEEA